MSRVVRYRTSSAAFQPPGIQTDPLESLALRKRGPGPTVDALPLEASMRRTRHLVEWHGELYTAEPLKTLTRVSSLPPVWAVSRRGEFIGTLPERPEETTKEFEVRCARWLHELLGGAFR